MSETRRKLPSELRKEQDDRDSDLGAALLAALATLDDIDLLILDRDGDGWRVSVNYQRTDATRALAALLRAPRPGGPDA